MHSGAHGSTMHMHSSAHGPAVHGFLQSQGANSLLQSNACYISIRLAPHHRTRLLLVAIGGTTTMYAQSYMDRRQYRSARFHDSHQCKSLKKGSCFGNTHPLRKARVQMKTRVTLGNNRLKHTYIPFQIFSKNHSELKFPLV